MKTALRMIPYGLYVLTSESKDGRIAAATINWVTQASFKTTVACRWRESGFGSTRDN